MKKEGALFDLVKSLSKSEKRFIKIYTTRYSTGDSHNSVKLFDAIDQLREYDEAKLKAKIYGSGFSGNLRGIKNYLYFLVLDCLDIYYNDSSTGRRISKYINIASVLSEKRLDGQSDKIIERTRRLASEFNQFENIIALNSIQKNTRFTRETITSEQVNSYYKENFSALENMRLKLEYNKLYDELHYKRLRIGPVASEMDKEDIKVFYDNQYLNDPPKSSSFDVNMFYLLSKIEYSRIVLDEKSGGIYIRKLIELFDYNKNRIVDYVTHYIYALNVFNTYRVYTNNRNEADSVLKKIIAIPSLIGEAAVSRDVRIQIFQTYHILSTHVALLFRDYEGAIPYIKSFETEKKKFEKDLTPTALLCMQSNIACIYFGLGQYKDALKWCSDVIIHPPSARYDIVYGVRILYLLINYELGNQIALPGLIVSAHRNFQKMKKVNQFVTILLKHLRLLLRAESKNEKALIFIDLRKGVFLLQDKPLENDIFNHIDVIGWIDKNVESLS